MPATNGKQLKYKPTKSKGGIRPSIPPGKWLDSTMPREKFRADQTKNGEPMLVIPIKLGRADDDAPEGNASYKGAEESLRIVFYDDDAGDKTRAANFMRTTLRALCDAVDVNYDDVYPEEINSPEDFDPLIKALGGKEIPELWTTNREATMASGEKTINVDIRFTEPRQAASSSSEEEDDEHEGRRPAKKSSKRR